MFEEENVDTNPVEEVDTEEEAPQVYKVGEKEYTAEQIGDLEKDSESYKHLQTDYTQKSQKLAEYEKANKPEADDTPAFMKPDWKPKDYQDLGQAIKQAAELGEKNALAKLQAQRDEQDQAKTELDNFIGEVKKTDKGFIEDDFYKHAKKHGFSIKTVDDLKGIYSSYKEVQKARTQGEDDALKNKGKRDGIAVAGPKGGKSEGGLTYKQIRASNGVRDAVSRYMNK